MRALIIVDMLEDFCRPDAPLFVPGVQEAMTGCRRELDRARAAGEKVIYVCDAHDPDDLEFKRYPPHAIAGTPGAAVVDELAPLPGEEVVTKRRLTPFYETRLHEVLAAAGVTEAVVCGVVTHICVMETVSGLCDRDIPATVPADAVADFDDEQSACALKRMASVFGANVV